MPEIKENSAEIKALIKEYSYLFWYTPEDKKENISLEFLTEMILNYGDLDAVRKLFKIAGTDTVAHVFYNDISRGERNKGNYFDLILNYFDLYFKRHVSSYPK